jgi:GT2 family glycosyltransferase
VSVFAVPKPFLGHIGVIQRNALGSWRQLGVAREVILLGQEDGIAEAAAEAGAIHFGPIGLDPFGTPLVDNVFEIARRAASADWLCYVNADIILMPEFGAAVLVAMLSFENCLIVSRRWNMDVREPLDFSHGWQERLRARAARDSKLYTPYGIDVFVFPKGLFQRLPPFSLGRPYWDNWMIFNARQRGFPVVDVTEEFSVIHQNHGYDKHLNDSVIRRSQQGLRNFWLAGDNVFGLGDINNATHTLENGEVKRNGRRTVSVVIPHAGTFAQLRGCLRALSEQSYPRAYIEVIVVENSDRAISAPVLLEFPFVKFTRETKAGPAAARNKGAAIAQGEIISFLDSDCRPAGDWIERGVEEAERRGMSSVVACNIRPWDPGYGTAGVKLYEALAYHDQKGYVEICQACITGALLVPRDAWIKVGPFDESFNEAACEDWEWSTRATSRGVLIFYCASAAVRHPVHSTWRELRMKARRLVRGELLLARKRRRHKMLSLEFQLAAYSKRLRSELARIISHKSIRWPLKLSVAAAAMAVWFWSILEVRKQLVSLPNSTLGRAAKRP